MKELASTKSRIKSSPNFIKGRAQNREKTALHPQDELQASIRQAYNQARLQTQSTQDNLKSSPKPHPQEVVNEPPMSKFRTIVSTLNPTNVVIPSIKSDLSEMQKSDSFVWFGHSSYMLNLGGKTLLIDPVLQDNAAPLPFVINAFKGADIYAPSELPTIDFLLITHNHYDHLSKSTIRAIASKVKKAIVPLGVGKYLKAWGISEDKITELDWNENVEFSVEFGVLRFHCLTARHYSSRGLLDRDKTLWASFLVEYSVDSHNSQSKKIFIGGDSGYGAHFAEFGKRFGTIDLAFLENGQYNPQWGQIHTFPHQNLQIAQELNAKAIMPVHNSKFRLAPHEWSEPLEQIYTLYLQGKSQNKFDFLLLTPQVGQIVPLWSEYKKGDFSAWWR